MYMHKDGYVCGQGFLKMSFITSLNLAYVYLSQKVYVNIKNKLNQSSSFINA